ncbi:uncharacterized protein LOC126457427 [Schistocerca serialis cubense]|uniref:uncharacterized protein LOC126457427 n=1 Tax=Schistocerca serialis cubense TaxID=2023355 RepID=UPI00214E8382|nr:uncharacterized protein LOC126457427 [Schistocerca serialis cubense]XP_049949654.1 uncharacterized protein LOC126457427 [Schistocerca serialis cubense]
MESLNETRPPPPSWINQEFIESVLINKVGNQASVDSIKVQYACPPGAGITSLLFRVTAILKGKDNEQEAKKESLLVKTALDFGPMKDLKKNDQVFRTETQMLREVMPQIQKMLASLEGEDFRPLTARCYDGGQQPALFLVLEDLSEGGFRMAEGQSLLNYQHCKAVLRAYARLHAASAFLLDKQPRYKSVFNEPMFTDKRAQDHFRAIGSKIMSALADELNKCPGYEKYSEKCRGFIDRSVNSIFEVLERMRKETTLPVLGHGDCWKNNFLFKYVDGELSDVRIVDFQVSYVTSPALDLQYFLYASASEEVHRHHMDDLLGEYHNTLVDILRRLGMQEEAEVFTLEELKREMDRCLVVGFLFSIMSSLALATEKYGVEFTKLFSDPGHAEEAFGKIFKNPSSLSYMKYLTPFFESKGIL